jgi:hypothetical protein
MRIQCAVIAYLPERRQADDGLLAQQPRHREFDDWRTGFVDAKLLRIATLFLALAEFFGIDVRIDDLVDAPGPVDAGRVDLAESRAVAQDCRAPYVGMASIDSPCASRCAISATALGIAVAEHVGLRIEQNGMTQFVLPVIVVYAAQRCLDATQHNRHIRVSRQRWVYSELRSGLAPPSPPGV